jgi:formyl-CoA transferase
MSSIAGRAHHESRGLRRDRTVADALIEAWTEKRTKHEAMEIAGAGVACGAVLDSGEVLASEHLGARGMVVELDHPQGGRFPTLGNPVTLSASPTAVRRPPLLGEHNAEVYGGLLGLSAEERGRLEEDGII